MQDCWQIGGQELGSRFFIGSAQYPSPDSLRKAVAASGAQVITMSLRREAGDGQAGQAFWRLLRETGAHFLPNTAGCKTVQEAVATAQMARELFETDWIKLEVIGDDYTLQPDVFKLVEAAHRLTELGFTVFPYTTDDLVVARELLDAGCRILMPWGSPIGSGKGLNNPYALETLRARYPDVQLIVDAGIGAPSHAARAMELGYDGVLLNTAVAKAGDPVMMARAFGQAIEAGRAAWLSGMIPAQDMASPSTPVPGTPFWHSEAG